MASHDTAMIKIPASVRKFSASEIILILSISQKEERGSHRVRHAHKTSKSFKKLPVKVKCQTHLASDSTPDTAG